METITKENIFDHWNVELSNKNRKRMKQYVVAECCDDAIEEAAKSFHARIHGLNKCYGSTVQKACKRSKLNGKYRVGFLGPKGAGHKTINADGLTVSELIEKAYSDDRMGWMIDADITEIYSLLQ